MQQRHDDTSRVHAQPVEAAVEAHADRQDHFSTGGSRPLMPGAETAALSASDRAYNAPDNDGPLSANGRVMEHEMNIDGRAIAEASKRYGIPEVDILAVITQESKGVASANAGARQKDHGAHAASGLMQVTEATWKGTVNRHSELAGYHFASHRYDRHANILVGTAALKDKRDALESLGVPATGANATALTTMAFNAGEGIVSEAYHHAVHAGSLHPAQECLRAEYLKPAIAKYPSVYAYYLTGGGKSKNPGRSVARAVELKFNEISKYPTGVQMLIAEANEHEIATTLEDDMPHHDPTMLASADERSDDHEA